MSEANVARVKAREALEGANLSIYPMAPIGPWCPLNGHAFTCPCRECSDYWGTSPGVMVWQAWKDHAYAVGDL